MFTTATMKRTKGVDEKFQIAIDVLNAYGRKHHGRSSIVARMEKARAEDTSALTTSKRLKEKLSVSEEFSSSLSCTDIDPSLSYRNRR